MLQSVNSCGRSWACNEGSLRRGFCWVLFWVALFRLVLGCVCWFFAFFLFVGGSGGCCVVPVAVFLGLVFGVLGSRVFRFSVPRRLFDRRSLLRSVFV